MINNFSGKYAFLSNFWVEDVHIDGVIYKSAEHAYQSAKAIFEEDAEQIRNAATPGKAKRLGREVEIRSDWEAVKFTVMGYIVSNKFTGNTNLREKLLATGEEELIEGNQWGDITWGVYNGVGSNHLGKLLMNVRTHCREVF